MLATSAKSECRVALLRLVPIAEMPPALEAVLPEAVGVYRPRQMGCRALRSGANTSQSLDLAAERRPVGQDASERHFFSNTVNSLTLQVRHQVAARSTRTVLPSPTKRCNATLSRANSGTGVKRNGQQTQTFEAGFSARHKNPKNRFLPIAWRKCHSSLCEG